MSNPEERSEGLERAKHIRTWDTLRVFNADTKTYNHMFDLAFAVEGSEYEDGYECIQNEKEKLIKALTDRINDLCNAGEEYLEAFGLCDTYEEE